MIRDFNGKMPRIADSAFVSEAQISPEQLLWLQKGSQSYAELLKQYKEQGL